MNRQIKFRVWNPDDKKMETPLVLAIVNDGTLNFKPLINCSDGNKAYKDYPLMQFTGLQDIKGKDIYEGDILCVPHLENTRHQVRMVIEWENENSRFTKYYPRNAFQIIGNIYENHKLLNSQK